MSSLHAAVLAALSAVSLVVTPVGPDAVPGRASPPMRAAPVNSADLFEFPLPEWQPHCLGFGSQWRYCNGTPLRECPATGAVWLHTGVDISTGIQPVMAAGDGTIAGYLIDPVFHGGVLIRHRTSAGVVLTQYWHVWLRPGFRVGSAVRRGQVFADVASMGDRTHFHFAVFLGDYEPHAWNGALPPQGCAGFPSFPYRFVDPTAFIEAHLPPVVLPRGTRWVAA